ncbi:MAG: glutamine synthetase type III [Ruminococcaceae bacterium]|nr:glutamine synthetase type III [Oscillospiraceae bacterium]
MSSCNIQDVFGCYVFSEEVMRERLSKETFTELKNTIDKGMPLSAHVAEAVAEAMKNWAMEQGATHYTHWFQPLNGYTAEKHDSFLSLSKDGTHAITEFSGKSLIKGEPDASSFPSGGLRATFEARGYTAWDCTSPAFLKEDSSGLTLCIPTAFCSYNGEALDKKTPLLRSVEAISAQAVRILRLFGDETTNRVSVSCGAEQEYFLIDKKMWKKRPDLVFTGRTLLGAKPPKTQEMDDHYFGTLKERVSAFMKELDLALWKIGVPAKTKHNEAAPAQHELAPIFETVNIACDHNQITMELMKKIADHHDMVCLLHEKPFAGLNGSGKHNNWSLTTPDGVNLLNPGKTPRENAQFLVFLCAVISAIDDHPALIRASAANAGNDYRLGALEAPPAIISIFLGDELTAILEEIESGEEHHDHFGGVLDTGVSALPNLPLDSTDRNRTSPFAFTGNKFEFRMVASSASIAGPNTVLNTIVADSLCTIADRLEQAKDFNKELNALLVDIIKKHKRIIFNGNGYGAEWIAEAKRRGLPNINNSVDSYRAFIYPESIAVFEKHHVYSETELRARYEIKMEKYSKIVGIEAQTLLQMLHRFIVPACMRFADSVAQCIVNVKATGLSCDTLAAEDLLRKVSGGIAALHKTMKKLEKAIQKAENFGDDYIAHANFTRDSLITIMGEVRKYADELESIVAKEYWPIPTYSDLIYSV